MAAKDFKSSPGLFHSNGNSPPQPSCTEKETNKAGGGGGDSEEERVEGFATAGGGAMADRERDTSAPGVQISPQKITVYHRGCTEKMNKTMKSETKQGLAVFSTVRLEGER